MSSVSAEGYWSVTQAMPAAFPPLALHAEIQGSVELKCGIGAEGSVTACIAVSGHPLLRAPALENARRWHFEQVRDAAPQPTEFVRRMGARTRRAPPVKQKLLQCTGRGKKGIRAALPGSPVVFSNDEVVPTDDTFVILPIHVLSRVLLFLRGGWL